MSLLSLILILPLSGMFQIKVRDAISREPVGYVEIEVLPAGKTFFTDSLGEVHLTGQDLPDAVTIVARRVGYETRTWVGVPVSGEVTLLIMPRAIPVAGATSTATRLVRRPAPAQPVTVIENKGFVNRGNVDLSGLVMGLPGVQVQDYGNLTTVSLRGTTVEQTLVLFDGVRLNSSLNNQADMTLLPPAFARQVEVVRGGASALYGANPIGGVINVITPTPESTGFCGAVGIGSLGRRHLNLGAMHSGLVDFVFAGSVMSADNRFTYQDQLDSLRVRVNGDVRRGNLLGKLGSGLGSGGRHYLSVLGCFTIAERGSPGPVTFLTDSARLKDERFLTILGYDWQETEDAHLSARIGHQRSWENYRNPNEFFPEDDTHRVYQTSFSANQLLVLSDWLSGNIGFESYLERAMSSAVGGPARWSNAPYLEFRLKGRGWAINTGVRYDRLRSSGLNQDSVNITATYGAFSPKVAFIFNPIPSVNCYLSANRSFRAPTFNELWWPRNNWSGGNPRLEPEWGTGVEGGVALNTGEALFIRLAGYRSQLSNLIQWQETEEFFWQPVNIARATITGAELEGKAKWRFLELWAGATYQVCQSAASDTGAGSTVRDLPYRPRLSGGSGVGLNFQKQGLDIARLKIGARAVSSRFTNSNNTDTLPGYVLMDAEVGFAPLNLFLNANKWQPRVTVGAKNVFNRRYQEIKDYPLPGRDIYLEIDIGW